jgi:hypothetical protein
MALTLATKANKLTYRQRKAVKALAEYSTTNWVRGDYLSGDIRRSLSSLIVWRMIEGKQVRAAHRTDYRFTDFGREIAAKVCA